MASRMRRLRNCLRYDSSADRTWDPVAANGVRHRTACKGGDQWLAARDGPLDGGKRQRRAMTLLVVPDFRDPDRVLVHWILCDDVTQASGHIAGCFEQDL